MQAEVVRTGWAWAVAGIAVGALAFALANLHTTALPPVADTDGALTPPLADTDVAVRDTARYVVVDLDQDGTTELVALGDGALGPELVVVEAVHHRPLARIPFGTPGNPCASDFAVDGSQLIVNDYAAMPENPNACQLKQSHHYRMRDGAVLVENVVRIDF